MPFAAAYLSAPLGAKSVTPPPLQHTPEHLSFCAAGIARRNTFYQTIYSALTASLNSASGAASALRGEPSCLWALHSPAGCFRKRRRRFPGVQAIFTHVCPSCCLSPSLLWASWHPACCIWLDVAAVWFAGAMFWKWDYVPVNDNTDDLMVVSD